MMIFLIFGILTFLCTGKNFIWSPFFVQRTNNAGNEPGAIIRQIDNTHNGSMSAQIVDVDGSSSGAFLIRFKTNTTESGETAYLNYHIMSQFDSIA